MKMESKFPRAAIAAVVLTLFLHTAGADPDLLFQKSFALFKDGLYAEAAAAFSALSRGDGEPELLESAEYMGIISLIQAGESAEARVRIASFMDRRKESGFVPELRYQSARLDLIEGKVEAAKSGFGSFISLHPQSPSVANALFWLAETHYLSGDFKEAFVAYEKFCGLYPGAEKFKVAESRMEEIKARLKREEMGRRLEFDNSTAQMSETEKNAREAELERMFELLYRSWSRMRISMASPPPLPKEEVPRVSAIEPEKPPAPVQSPPPAQTKEPEAVKERELLLAAEEARLRRLAELLDLKRQTLELLSSVLLKFAGEVAK